MSLLNALSARSAHLWAFFSLTPTNWKVFVFAGFTSAVYSFFSFSGLLALAVVSLVLGFVHLAYRLGIERWVPTFTSVNLIILGLSAILLEDRLAFLPFVISFIVARLSLFQKPNNPQTIAFGLFWLVMSTVGFICSLLFLMR